jgi:hypothetical protein
LLILVRVVVVFRATGRDVISRVFVIVSASIRGLLEAIQLDQTSDNHGDGGQTEPNSDLGQHVWMIIVLPLQPRVEHLSRRERERGRESERQGEGERQRERDRERQTEEERHIQRDSERERETETDTERDRGREGNRDTERERQRQRERETEGERDRGRETEVERVLSVTWSKMGTRARMVMLLKMFIAETGN